MRVSLSMPIFVKFLKLLSLYSRLNCIDFDMHYSVNLSSSKFSPMIMSIFQPQKIASDKCNHFDETGSWEKRDLKN